ncbi:1-phosphatidylinositol 4 [Tropilaelaps mercedesae]|uniref:Phosphoinositide phospholipase C n=1 Tax=Tropilaelaps mercedesae TaxID=418985 RepID=A0A1V9XRB1_9ACAR|nr:1-phosphatidylinositol 4 [Tropilaelaps mercedesae]
MASFSEATCEAILSKAKDTQSFVDFARTHLARVYPKGRRVLSENFDPTPLFNIGCQLVALNYQTPDKYRFYNLSKFAQNGNCGYVLKPRILREGFNFSRPDPNLRCRVLVKIISGQHIPTRSAVVDPYVEVKIIGHPTDEKSYQTTFAKQNGFSPNWRQTFEFEVNVPDLAQLVFILMSDSYSGQFTKPERRNSIKQYVEYGPQPRTGGQLN